jgi:site-specific DNA recombinase
MLTNPIYLGRIRHMTHWYQGEHEAIVEDKVFEEVGAMLRSHGRGGSGNLVSKYQSLLRGLLYCPACNRSMVHNVAKRESKVYRYYTCVTVIKRGRKHCPSPSLPAGQIEAVVVDEVRAIAGDAGLRREVLSQSIEQSVRELEELQKQRTQLLKQISRTDEHIRKIVDQSDINATRQLADLHEQRDRCRRSMTQVDEEITRVNADQITEQDVNTSLADFDNIWNALNTLEQWELLKLLISRVEFDAAESSLSISMHPAGIRTLANQANEEVSS